MAFIKQYLQMQHTLSKISRLGWTQQEEQLLLKLYQVDNIRDWSLIAQKINQSGNVRRTSKQCRQRFSNYVRCNGQPVNQKAWEKDQQRILFQKYKQLGSKWVQISKYIPGRPQNCIKNRFYGSLRKIVRNLNKLLKQSFKNSCKQVKYQTLINILQENNNQEKKLINYEKTEFYAFVEEIKSDLINFITSHQQNISEFQALELFNKIQKYSKITKLSLLSKIRKCKSLKRKSLPPFVSKKKLPQGQIIAQQSMIECQFGSIQQKDQKTQDQQQIILQNKLKNNEAQLISLLNYLTPLSKSTRQEQLKQFLPEQDEVQKFLIYGWY